LITSRGFDLIVIMELSTGFYSKIPHMWSRNKINSVLATIYFISAPSVRTCNKESRNKINRR